MREATLKQLRSLDAMIGAGTIAAAAKRLHVTPPAVAQQLRLLERAVGMTLFDRTPDGLRPTDAGRELLATIARVEFELDTCWRSLDLIRQGKVGHVVLGAVSTAKYFAPSLLAAFWAEHPDVDVKLHVGNRGETIDDLAANRFDLVIMGRPPVDRQLETDVLGDHPHVLIASPRHHLAEKRGIALSFLADERFLVREQGSGTRLLSDWLLTSADVAPPVAMEFSSNETIKQAVIADLGIALISAHTVAAELDDGRLIALDVTDTPIMRQWYVVRRRGLTLTAAGREMWTFLVSRGREFLPPLRPIGGSS